MFLIIICVLAIAAGAHARSWYVKPDSTGDAPTIQAAIDSSRAGDSVVVAPGTYEEKVYCESKDSLTIASEAGPESTILHAPAYNIINIGNSQHIELTGFTYENFPDHGVIVEYSYHVTIDNCVFRNGGLSAILLCGSSSVTLQANLAYANRGAVYCTDICSDIYVIGNTISYNSGTGVDFGSAYGCYVGNNLIAYNECGVEAAILEPQCNDVFGNDMNYTLLYGSDPTGTSGNISMDPLFCAVAPGESGNFLLQRNSPCASGNHPDGYSCGTIGLYDIGCGSTATEKATWGKIKSLYR
ncbi:MAG: NosD domain-containing protein [Candidatus Krumholzibacteria bacterium]|nr:NosD domain-containing protein [Candidatus Krumholzibacteria bacterium]